MITWSIIDYNDYKQMDDKNKLYIDENTVDNEKEVADQKWLPDARKVTSTCNNALNQKNCPAVGKSTSIWCKKIP